MHRTQTIGIVLVASAIFVLSLSGVMVRQMSVDAWTIIFWRSAFMAPVMLLVITATRKGKIAGAFKEAGMTGFFAGVVIGAGLALYIFSISRTMVANTVVLLSSAPLFAALLGLIILKERVRAGAWITIAVAGYGIVVMFVGRTGAGELTGNLLAIAAAVLYALNIVLVRTRPHANMIPVVFFAGLTSMAITFPLADLMNIAADQLLWLAAMGICQLGFGLVLFTFGAQRLPAAQTAMIALVEVILAPLWVWWAISEVPSDPVLVGGAIVLGAVAAHTLLTLRRKPALAN